MGRKRAVDKLPQAARERVREKLADGAESLDQVRTSVGAEFPGVKVPGITSLHREKERIERWAERSRQAKLITDAWLEKLGNAPESQIGKMLQESLRLLAFHATEQLQDDRDAGEAIDVKAFAAVARSFLAIENAARISAERERELIAEGERRATEKIGKAGRSIGLTADQARKLRAELGGASAK